VKSTPALSKLQAVIMPVPLGVRELTGKEKVQVLSAHARTALALSARLSGVVLGPLEKGARGEPLSRDGVHWSISHTTDFVAAVTAPHRVGIDIEKVKPFGPALRSRVAGHHEWHLVREADDTLCCRFWTAKEAVLKAVGIGLGGLSKCSIVDITDQNLRLDYETGSWMVSHCSRAPNHLAAVTVDDSGVSWHFVDEQRR
jgi:4'-phosphopantetheinyl transferase